jgi:hypothetical protein
MDKSIPVKQKKRGRPATGVDPLVGVRMPPEERRAVEAWAAKQPEKLSLSKAIRSLVQLGLDASASGKSISAAAESAHTPKARKATKAAPPKKTHQRRP